MAAQRPANLVFINPSHWRADSLSHLAERSGLSPNLDRLTKEGALSFRNAFTTSPDTQLATLSLMSGWHSSAFSGRTREAAMGIHTPNLLKSLKDEGYVVWWWGRNDFILPTASPDPYCHVRFNGAGARRVAWQLDRESEWRGEEGEAGFYSQFLGHLDTEGEEHYHDKDWDNVLSLVDLVRSYPRSPFCIYLGLTYPQPPYAVESPYFEEIDRKSLREALPVPAGWIDKPGILKAIYDRQNLKNLGAAKWKELRAVYYGMCRRVDAQIGLIVETLRETGTLEDTFLVIAGDSGDYAGDYGLVEKNLNTFEDSLVRVPMILKFPSWLPCKGGVRDSLVQTTDLVPTLEELFGIQCNPSQSGHSLVPLAEGEQELRGAVFAEGGLEPNQSESMGSGKQCPSHDLRWPRKGLEMKENPLSAKARMIRSRKFKYVQRSQERDELYDLEKDPGELTNKIGDGAYQAVLESLRHQLIQFHSDTSEMLQGRTQMGFY